MKIHLEQHFHDEDFKISISSLRSILKKLNISRKRATLKKIELNDEKGMKERKEVIIQYIKFKKHNFKFICIDETSLILIYQPCVDILQRDSDLM